MIVIDPVATFIRNGRPIRAANLLSTEPGIEGSKELVKFARGIGIKVNWLRKDASEHEHFELHGVKIDEAVKAGALKVDRHRLVEIVKKKRQKVAKLGPRER